MVRGKKQFNSRLELLQEFESECSKRYQSLVSLKDFSSFEAFKKFYDLYDPDKRPEDDKERLLSAFSERFFMLFLADLFKDKKWEIIHQRRLILEKLTENGEATYKTADVALIMDGQELLIDLKVNIDLVEKDLFKGYLIQRKKLGGLKENLKYFLIIFEKKDDSKNKRDMRDSQSLQLLEHGKKEGLISDYFYFPCKNESSYMEEEFDETKERLIESFSGRIARF